jgi:hypothetical protein
VLLLSSHTTLQSTGSTHATYPAPLFYYLCCGLEPLIIFMDRTLFMDLMHFTDRCQLLNCSVPLPPHPPTPKAVRYEFITNCPCSLPQYKGPGTRCARCHFRAQKSLDFRAHPFKRPSFWISPHPNLYVPPHIKNRYINS